MKSLSPGNYALSIAHPGHELRLHGFLEQAKPFVWILTDGSHRTGRDMMMDSIRAIDKATKHGVTLTKAFVNSDKAKKIFKLSFPNPDNPQELIHLKDSEIYSEIINQHTGLFERYINDMAASLIKYNINFLVSDSPEGTNAIHEMTNIMNQITVKLVKKKSGKEIKIYDYAIDRNYKTAINDDCIKIVLDDDAVERKLNAIIKYPFAIMDMKPNISFDHQLVMTVKQLPDANDQIKQWMKNINMDFLRNEYLRPYPYSENVVFNYEITEITYEEHQKPLQEKLEQLILQ